MKKEWSENPKHYEDFSKLIEPLLELYNKIKKILTKIINIKGLILEKEKELVVLKLKIMQKKKIEIFKLKKTEEL